MFENIVIERRVRWQEMAKQKQEELLQEQRSISAVLESYAQERLAIFYYFAAKPHVAIFDMNYQNLIEFLLFASFVQGSCACHVCFSCFI